MPFAGRTRRRHPHLESFLLRNFGQSECPAPSSVRYEPCVVSGIDPSAGLGPMPHFGYLIAVGDRLLVVRWPAKNVDTLVHLKDVDDIVAVAGVSPVFLFSPFKEKAQQVRVYYHPQPEVTSRDEPAAVDLYFLDPRTSFLNYLRKHWIQQLINSTLTTKSAVLKTDNSAGWRYYQRMIEILGRSKDSDAKSLLPNIYRISVWAKRHLVSRQAFWSDLAVFDWVFDRLQELVDTDKKDEEIDNAILDLLECLAAILDAACDASWWTFLETRLRLIASALIRLSRNNTFRNVSVSASILNSVLWFPNSASPSSPFQTLARNIMYTPDWENLLNGLLHFAFSILKCDQKLLLPEEIVALFKIFFIFRRLVDERNILQFVRFQYSEEFRYFVSEEQLLVKFPQRCVLKNHVILLANKLKSVVLCAR